MPPTPISPPTAFPTASDRSPTDFTVRPNRFVTALSLPPRGPSPSSKSLGGRLRARVARRTDAGRCTRARAFHANANPRLRLRPKARRTGLVDPTQRPSPPETVMPGPARAPSLPADHLNGADHPGVHGDASADRDALRMSDDGMEAAHHRHHQICERRGWTRPGAYGHGTSVQRRDGATARGFVPTDFDCTPSTTLSGWQLRHEFTSHRGRKIVCEIWDEVEPQSIPRRTSPVVNPRPLFTVSRCG